MIDMIDIPAFGLFELGVPTSSVVAPVLLSLQLLLDLSDCIGPFDDPFVSEAGMIVHSALFSYLWATVVSFVICLVAFLHFRAIAVAFAMNFDVGSLTSLYLWAAIIVFMLLFPVCSDFRATVIVFCLLASAFLALRFQAMFSLTMPELRRSRVLLPTRARTAFHLHAIIPPVVFRLDGVCLPGQWAVKPGYAASSDFASLVLFLPLTATLMPVTFLR